MSISSDGRNFDQEANEALYSKDHKRSLLLSIMAMTGDLSDWPVIRLATNIGVVLGAAESLSIYDRFDSPERGANFLMHKSEKLIENDQHDRAIETLRRLAAFSAKERINVLALVKVVSLLFRIKHAELYRHFLTTYFRQLLDNPWALNSIVREARDYELFSDVIVILYECMKTTDVSANSESASILGFLFITSDLDLSSVPAFGDGKNLLLDEFRSYYQDNRVETSKAIVSRLTTASKFLDPKQVAGKILSAIAQREGFSFLRIGDGEGRFVGPHLRRFPHLWSETQAIAKRVWFWNSKEIPDAAFFRSLEDAYLNANVIGLNPEYRITLESRNNLFGYLGVTNGNRFLFEHQDGYKGFTCNNWDNVVLESMNFYRELPNIARQIGCRICIISPHKGLISRIDWLAEADLIEFVIPSEGHPAIVGDSLSEPHYPDTYHRCLRFIESRSGDIFLIAAGVFAKLYCEAARSSGNIAIDLGSLIDKWLSYQTR